MCWLDETTLAVGRGYRTNAAAHDQLAEILAREGVTVERADLPHHLGPAHVMHLMSVVSPVAPDLAVVFEPLAPVPLLELLADRGYRTVPADPDELDDQGCNVLAVRPGVVVMADTAPRTRAALERAGVEVHSYRLPRSTRATAAPPASPAPCCAADRARVVGPGRRRPSALPPRVIDRDAGGGGGRHAGSRGLHQ